MVRFAALWHHQHLDRGDLFHIAQVSAAAESSTLGKTVAAAAQCAGLRHRARIVMSVIISGVGQAARCYLRKSFDQQVVAAAGSVSR